MPSEITIDIWAGRTCYEIETWLKHGQEVIGRRACALDALATATRYAVSTGRQISVWQMMWTDKGDPLDCNQIFHWKPAPTSPDTTKLQESKSHE